MKCSATAALTISIILNIVLAGMLLGEISGHMVAPRAFNASAAVAKLPPEKHRLFNDILSPAKKKMDEERVRINAAKKEAVRILAAEPFDASAYRSQVRHISEMIAEMKLHMADEVSRLAGQFTPEQRAILGEIVSHPPFALQPAPPEK